MEDNKVITELTDNPATESEANSAPAAVQEKPKKKKRKWLRRILCTLGILLLALIVTAAVLLYGPVRTMSTVEQIDQGIYKLTYQQDYHLDKALKANIVTEDDFMKFASDTFFFGYPVEANPDYVACSTFLTQNEDGQYLAGRNFDYSETDLLTIYTHPDKGYASIGMVPLGSFNIGITGGIETMSNLAKFLMLASPYMCVDGINEKGLMVAVLDLNPQKIRQDTGKPKINTMVAVRLLLDRAATVDEAIELLSQYDFNSMSKYAQHIYVADAQGKSAVVEWQMNNVFGADNGYKMYVVESNVCTNFWMYEGKREGECNRFDTITQRLAEKPVNAPEDAMENLKAASVSWTQWLCVYQLSDFSVNVALDNKYGKVFRISPDEFR